MSEPPSRSAAVSPPALARAAGAIRRLSLLHIGASLVLFWLLARLFRRTSILPEEAYYQSSILLATLKNIPQLGLWSFPLIFIIAYLIWQWKPASRGWGQWEHGRTMRVVVMVSAAVAVWPAATYDFNYYFDRGHSLDRLLVVALLAACWWKPIVVLPLTGLVISLFGQFWYPIDNFSWAIPDLSLHILILFLAYFLVSMPLRAKRPEVFFLLLLCMVASHYFPSGYSKVRANWFFVDRPEFLLTNMHANGWLAFLPPEKIASLTKSIGTLSFFLKLFTIALECGCLFLMIHRRLACFFLAGWICFHLGVFLVTGICLWPWVVIEGVLLTLLWRGNRLRSLKLFSPAYGVVGLVIIASSLWWLGAVRLTWFDGRASYAYRFTAIGESGKGYELSPGFFAPYDYQFSIANFHFVSKEPSLGISASATRRSVAEALAGAKTPEDVFELERRIGTDLSDEEKSQRFQEFLERFIANLNARPHLKRRLHWIAAPPYLWNSGRPDRYRFQERIRRVDMRQVMVFFDGEQYLEIRTRPVLSVEIRNEKP